jgi:hemoglobin
MNKDIGCRADIELLMSKFYDKLLMDESVSYIFTEVAKLNLKEHLPILADFWESVLLHSSTYKGNVMLKHIELDQKTTLTKEHFDRWTHLFFQTMEEHFHGPVADEAKRRVILMGELMQFKIASARDKGFLH